MIPRNVVFLTCFILLLLIEMFMVYLGFLFFVLKRINFVLFAFVQPICNFIINFNLNNFINFETCI